MIIKPKPTIFMLIYTFFHASTYLLEKTFIFTKYTYKTWHRARFCNFTSGDLLTYVCFSYIILMFLYFFSSPTQPCPNLVLIVYIHLIFWKFGILLNFGIFNIWNLVKVSRFESSCFGISTVSWLSSKFVSTIGSSCFWISTVSWWSSNIEDDFGQCSNHVLLYNSFFLEHRTNTLLITFSTHDLQKIHIHKQYFLQMSLVKCTYVPTIMWYEYESLYFT